MPTNNERREVAENLRNMIGYGECRYAEQFYELLKETVMESWDFHEFEDVAGRLADLIEPEERTCKNLSTRKDGFACSVCKYEVVGCMIDDFGSWDNPLLFCHCPNCDAKVVENLWE